MRNKASRPERNRMKKNILECALQGPCPAVRDYGGRDVCAKEEGACEYQMLATVNEDLRKERNEGNSSF